MSTRRPRPVGRVRPYGRREIRRTPCVRCGRPASQQWSVCSLGNRWCPLCDRCDVSLNRLVLRWTRLPDWRERARRYALRMARR